MIAGVYIFGSVGSGKSLVMDLFYESVAELKLVPFHRRVHFNAAMLEVRKAFMQCPCDIIALLFSTVMRLASDGESVWDSAEHCALLILCDEPALLLSLHQFSIVLIAQKPLAYMTQTGCRCTSG